MAANKVTIVHALPVAPPAIDKLPLFTEGPSSKEMWSFCAVCLRSSRGCPEPSPRTIDRNHNRLHMLEAITLARPHAPDLSERFNPRRVVRRFVVPIGEGHVCSP
jgi:hypothetical protein